MVERQGERGELLELSAFGTAQLAQAVLASGDILYEWDLTSDRVTWAGGTAEVFGRGAEALPESGEAFQQQIHPEDQAKRSRAVSEQVAEGGRFDCEYRLRRPGGGFLWLHDRGSVILSKSGSASRLVGVLRVVTERKQHEARLEYLANYDDLTGHFNKQRLREALDQALVHSLRFEQNGAFLVLGLDQMGRINSAYGHEAGDTVLSEIARRLEQSLRPTDVIGRLGSDRLGVVLVGCPEHQAQGCAERVLQIIRQAPVKIGEGQVHVTCSASLVFFPEQSKTSFDLIAKGEGALLMAKAAGRDCLAVYEMNEEQMRDNRASLRLGERVKTALQDGRLVFAYQPVVDAVSQEVRFFESLLRMRAEDGSIIPAKRFVPVVEELGLVRMVDRRALDLAIHELEAYPDLNLAVNISGLTAADRSWLRRLVGRLKGRPDLATRLVVEITETAALYDIEESASFVATVRDLGCRVALDDFGAGYTTFRHLKALTVDLVKIDGSFVRDIRNNTENQLFIRNLLSLARSFGLETVAECVENAEDAAFLRDEGIELLQGYHFGRPQVVEPKQLLAALPQDDALRVGRV